MEVFRIPKSKKALSRSVPKKHQKMDTLKSDPGSKSAPKMGVFFGGIWPHFSRPAPQKASGIIFGCIFTVLGTILEGFPQCFQRISNAFPRCTVHARSWDLHLIWGPAVARRMASSINNDPSSYKPTPLQETSYPKSTRQLYCTGTATF